MQSQPVNGDSPWHSAYTAPRNTSPDSITKADLLAMMTTGKIPGKDYILADLRRADHEVRYSELCIRIKTDCIREGRLNRRFNQFTSSKSSCNDPNTVHTVQERRYFTGHLVLW